MRLKEYIEENGLNAKIIELNTSTKTVKESVEALGCDPENIIKSIIVVTNTSEFYLIIVQGDRRIKTKKVKKLLNVKDIKLASPEQVEKITGGYKIGDVPPISIELPVIVDELVINQKMVYAGGGASSKNLYISIDELLDCTHPLIADISTPL